MTTTKYAVDIIAPTKIIDKVTGEIVIIEDIVPAPFDKLIFDGYFEMTGDPWVRTLDWDSQVKVTEGS